MPFGWNRSFISSGSSQTSTSPYCSLLRTEPAQSLSSPLSLSSQLCNGRNFLLSDNEWLADVSSTSLNKLDRTSYDATTFLMLNGIGHIIIRFIGYPPTLLKTQVQADTTTASQSSMRVMREVVKREGVTGLFKGLPLSLTLTVFRQAYFLLYESLRAQLGTEAPLVNIAGPEYRFVCRDAFAAFGASSIFQVLSNPIDVVVQRMMVQKRGPNPTSNISTLPPAPPGRYSILQPLARILPSVALTRDLLHADGVRSFYRGFLSSVLLYSTSSALWWGSFDWFLDHLTRTFPPSAPPKEPGLMDVWLSPPVAALYHNHSWTAQHIAAASSSLLSVILTQPLDVCRTRLMVSSRAGDGLTARSVMKALWREGGVKSLMTGLGPRITSVVPSSVLTMAVYQQAKLFSVESKQRRIKANMQL